MNFKKINLLFQRIFFTTGATFNPDVSYDMNRTRLPDDTNGTDLWNLGLMKFFWRTCGLNAKKLFLFSTFKIPLEFVSILCLSPLLGSLDRGDQVESLKWMLLLCVGLFAQGLNQNHFFHTEILIMKSIERLGIKRIFRSQRADLVHCATHDLSLLTELPIVFAEIYCCTGIIIGGVSLLFHKIGSASFVAVGLILLLSPIATRLSAQVESLSDQLSKTRNLRVSYSLGLYRLFPALKTLNYEETYLRNLDGLRKHEENDKKAMIFSVVFPKLVFYFSSALVCLGTFAAFIWLGGSINVDVVFSTFLTLKIIDFPISSISELTIMLAKTKSSFKRVVAIEKQTAIEKLSLLISPNSFELTLTNEKIMIPNNSLVAVVGATGSGKSYFLNELFEALKTDISVHLVSQNPFIFAGTVQENIQLDQNFSSLEMAKLLKQVELTADEFHESPAHLQLQESGSNISGGQRQRIALARALASQSQVILFDDALSSVDGNTRALIFRHLIELRTRYRAQFVVTNSTAEAKACDFILQIENRSITLVKNEKEIRPLLLDGFRDSVTTTKSDPETKITPDLNPDLPLDVATSSIFWTSIWNYLKSLNAGWFPWELSFIFALAGLCLISGNLQNIFLQMWSSDGDRLSFLGRFLNDIFLKWNLDIHFTLSGLIVYAFLAFISLGLMSLRLVCWELITIRGAGRILHRAVAGLFSSDEPFMHKMHAHDLDQRLVDDFRNIDDHAHVEVESAFTYLMSYLIAASTIFFFSFQFVLLYAIFLTLWTFLFQKFLKTNSRLRIRAIQAKGVWLGQLNSGGQFRSAILHSGADNFIYKRLLQSLDRYQRIDLQINAVRRWFLGLSPLLGSALLFAILVVMRFSNEPASLTALVVTFSVQQWMLLNVLARSLDQIQTYSLSMQRVFELAHKNPIRVVETPLLQPARPRILQVKVAHFGYDRPILSVPELTFMKGQISVLIGRTGSGKSTFVKGLLGMAQRFSGQIILDQIPLSSLVPYSCYVGQDPVFMGNILREELELSGLTQDSQLREALLRAGLERLSHQLDVKLDELSIGEQQLICAIRALGSQKPILIFDEVTSKLDATAETNILRFIEQSKQEKIIIIVSHRVTTNVFADQIIKIENSVASVL